MRLYSRPNISRSAVAVLAALSLGGSYLVFATNSRAGEETPISPKAAEQSLTVAAANEGADAAPAEAIESFELSADSEAGIAFASLKTQSSRLIRVGLTTKGGPIALQSQSSSFVSDGDQPGRRLTIPAGQQATFTLGVEKTLAARGVTYKGPIAIVVGKTSYGAWRRPVINIAGGPTRVSSDGGSPRWGRPYRGSFEIAPQTYSFEPAKHKSALRLVNIVPIEEYLKGVVPWEMSPTAPLEALKAQSICARGETLAKIQNGRHRADEFEICDYDHCQGYPGIENENARSSLAVEQTVGLVLLRDGEIADAVYGTNSGGITADKNDVWRGGPAPHLQSVRDFDPKRHVATARAVKPRMTEADWVFYCTNNLPSFAQPSAEEISALAARRRKSARTAELFQKDDLPEFYRWSREVSLADLASAASLKSTVPFATVEKIEVVDRAASGHIKLLTVVGRAADGSVVSASYEKDGAIRSLLSGRLGSTTALPSSTFVVIPHREKGVLTGFAFKGAGWGHGAGMCQRGAQNHARAGWDARQILQWYFNGVQVLPAP
jgi:SpoIID/LytB domain protein